ncbi:TCR/Tet family MFS transporter [Burkholderia plantarii]|uniref:TCR/Tet family MFS transporter n=1 Tax=Burkholderia plantarii TaxID=41899 RepID=UPI0018DEBC44|nr:TCR/Tet family MFS transporter [Burkholderia plantarii]MBI0325686.1 TCR/Tet family MFS transporter [Burkholderia plantarii]
MSTPVAAGEPRASRAAFGFIFATALMNTISFGIVLPVLPNLIKAFAGGDTALATEWSTLFAVVWGAMQFVCAPALGALSDRIGRRPVLLISLAGLAADSLIMALAPNLAWLFVGRLLNGLTSASLSTANAYVADVTPPERRARAFGRIGAAVSLGFLAGPALGGLLAGVDLRLPCYVAGALSACNFLYGLVVLPESLAPAARVAAIDRRKLNPLGALTFLKARADLRGLALLAFLVSLGWMVGPAIFVLYGGYRYGWSPAAIGLVMMASGGLGSFVQIVLVGPVVARVGERGALLAGAGMGALGYAGFGLAATGAGYLAAVPVYVMFNLFMPALQGLITRRVGEAEQGQLQGALQGLTGLASLVGPLVYGLGFAWSIGPRVARPMPGFAFFVASALMALALLLALRIARPDARGAAGAA